MFVPPPQLTAAANALVSNLTSNQQTTIQTAALTLLNNANPIKIPEVGELLNLVNRGHINKETFLGLARRNGYNFTTGDGAKIKMEFSGNIFEEILVGRDRLVTVWDKIGQFYSYIPPITEIIAMDNRGKLTLPLFGRMIERITNNDVGWQHWYKELAKEYPGPSDLIRFALREAFNENIITQFTYNKEVPTNVNPYMKAQGLGWELESDYPPGTTDHEGNVLRGKENWLAKYWYAHWALPSVQQGFEMLHRLYEESPHGPSPDWRVGTEFKVPDMELLLKAQDYPEYWRQRMIRTSYHPINITDAKDMFRLDVGGVQTYYHSLRRQGFQDSDAQLMVQLLEKKKLRSLGLDPAKVSKEWICSVYQDGVIEDADAVNLMMANGWSQAQSQAMLQKCKLNYRSKLARSYIAGVKQGIINGTLSANDADTVLQTLGINQITRNEKIGLWVFQRNTRYRLATVKQLMEAHKVGAISTADLDSRLANLGLVDSDRSRIVRTAIKIMQKQMTDALLKQAKQVAAQAKANADAAMKAAKEQIKNQATQIKNQQKKIDNRARMIASVSKDDDVIAWYENGWITLVDLYYRLFMRRYGKSDARNWIEQRVDGLTQGALTNAESQAERVYLAEGNMPFNFFEPANPNI